MNRRKLLLIAGASTVTTLAGCAGGGDNGDDNGNGSNGNGNGDDNGDDTDTEPTNDEPDYGDLGGYEFSGSGATVESGLTLEGGLITVDATHDGSSNFQVYLVGPDRDHLFVNEIGDYAGETADLLDDGEYSLDVEADGDWEIEVNQPIVNRGYDLPVDESGDGPTLIGPYEFDGTQTFTGTHSGESNFQVHIYPEWGNSTLVFNEIGQYEGSTTARFDGPGWVGIQADGSWSVEIE